MDKKLKELIGEYKYKTELHCHSKPVSPCGVFPPEEVVHIYRAAGYDAITLTNHLYSNMRYEGDTVRDAAVRYADAFKRAESEGEKEGLRVIYGMELKFDEGNNDYLVYGVTPEETVDIFPYLSGGFKEFRSSYKNENMVLIQAHPCRPGITKADPELLDGVEGMNLQPAMNSVNAYAVAFAREVGKIITSGSDFHQPGTQGTGGIYSRTLPRDTRELAALLRSGDYLLNFGGLPVFPEAIK